MKKRYDYHNVENFKLLLFGLSFFLAGWAIYISVIEPSTSGKIFFVSLSVICMIMPFPTYLDRINTYIEVTEETILFHGWRKIIFATWAQVREIKTLTPIKGSLRYKIYTDKGNFVIQPAIQPADQEALTIGDFLKNGNATYQNELVSEIRRRAPRIKASFSPFSSPESDRVLKVFIVILLLALICLAAFIIWITIVR